QVQPSRLTAGIPAPQGARADVQERCRLSLTAACGPELPGKSHRLLTHFVLQLTALLLSGLATPPRPFPGSAALRLQALQPVAMLRFVLGQGLAEALDRTTGLGRRCGRRARGYDCRCACRCLCPGPLPTSSHH